MTLNDLNSVRNLKKFLAEEEIKLQALKDCAISITPKFKRENYFDEQGKLKSFTALDDSPKGFNFDSKVEKIVVMIIETEQNLEKHKKLLQETKLTLTQKICEEFSDSIEQSILLYRYVSCRSFREIPHLMHYSLRSIFYVHERILKNLS